MLAVIVCLVGIAAILTLAQALWQYKILRGEYQRKFVHIVGGCFVASWPWLISWQAIRWLGLLLLIGTLINRRHKYMHYHVGIKRDSYGDLFAALAIITCAFITTDKVFFAIAMVELALADGIAAIVGQYMGKYWRYKVFHHTKTVMGTMAFWITSTYILGVGLLFAHSIFPYNQYAGLLLLLPPILSILENVAIMGLDDLVVPVALIFALHLVQTA